MLLRRGFARSFVGIASILAAFATRAAAQEPAVAPASEAVAATEVEVRIIGAGETSHGVLRVAEVGAIPPSPLQTPRLRPAPSALCAFPCVSSMSVGAYRLALDFRGQRTISATHPVLIDRTGLIEVEVVARRGRGVVGPILMVLSLGVGASIWLPFAGYADGAPNWGAIFPLELLAGAGIYGGARMTAHRRRIDVRFYPYVGP